MKLSLLHVYGDGVRIDTVFTKVVNTDADLASAAQSLFSKTILPKNRDDEFTRFGVRPALAISFTENGLTHVIRQASAAADIQKIYDHRASAQCAMPF